MQVHFWAGTYSGTLTDTTFWWGGRLLERG